MKLLSRLSLSAFLGVLILAAPRVALAHCDGMDGPVVQAARKALESGNVNLVLIWVQPQNQGEIQAAFQETLAVRKLNPQAQELADRYFFETLVRIHREGEGAPYTGLKPAGRDLGAAIPAADQAIRDAAVERLARLLEGAVRQGVQEHFARVLSRKNFSPHDVAAGREYVKAYVEFIHYAERIYEASRQPAHGHAPERFESHSGTRTP